MNYLFFGATDPNHILYLYVDLLFVQFLPSGLMLLCQVVDIVLPFCRGQDLRAKLLVLVASAGVLVVSAGVLVVLAVASAPVVLAVASAPVLQLPTSLATGPRISFLECSAFDQSLVISSMMPVCCSV